MAVSEHQLRDISHTRKHTWWWLIGYQWWCLSLTFRIKWELWTSFLKFVVVVLYKKNLLAANVLHGIFHICGSPPFNSSLCQQSSGKPVWNLFFQASLRPSKSRGRDNSHDAPLYHCSASGLPLLSRGEGWNLVPVFWPTFDIMRVYIPGGSMLVTGIPQAEFPQKRRTNLGSRQTVSRLDPENLFTKRQHENRKSVRKRGKKSLQMWHILVWSLSQRTSAQLKGSLSTTDK